MNAPNKRKRCNRHAVQTAIRQQQSTTERCGRAHHTSDRYCRNHGRPGQKRLGSKKRNKSTQDNADCSTKNDANEVERNIHLVPNNPAHSPKISCDSVTLVEERRVEDGGGNEQRINGGVVFGIGRNGGHSPPQSDLVMLHVELRSRSRPAGGQRVP